MNTTSTRLAWSRNSDTNALRVDCAPPDADHVVALNFFDRLSSDLACACGVCCTRSSTPTMLDML